MKQEEIKELLNINHKKVFIFAIFIAINFIFSSYFWDYLGFRKMGGADNIIGFPFTFYSYRTSAPLPDTNWVIKNFSLSYLFLDLIIGYFVSCIVIYLYSKFKNK